METYQPRRSLADRVVVITSASRGIGREIAIRAAADGATVALLANRTPQIMADAAHALTTRPATARTGGFLTDEEVLRDEGLTDFAAYRLAVEESDLAPNFYLPHVTPPQVGAR